MKMIIALVIMIMTIVMAMVMITGFLLSNISEINTVVGIGESCKYVRSLCTKCFKGNRTASLKNVLQLQVSEK